MSDLEISAHGQLHCMDFDNTVTYRFEQSEPTPLVLMLSSMSDTFKIDGLVKKYKTANVKISITFDEEVYQVDL